MKLAEAKKGYCGFIGSITGSHHLLSRLIGEQSDPGDSKPKGTTGSLLLSGFHDCSEQKRLCRNRSKGW